jgi:hypothetical protein
MEGIRANAKDRTEEDQGTMVRRKSYEQGFNSVEDEVLSDGGVQQDSLRTKKS